MAVQLVLRVVYALRHRVDSDEPQHLHVAWGWAHGLIQYRDVFDNHTPLFHLLSAPLVRALGERADIVVMMRLAMIPVVAAGLIALWLIGRRLFDRRTALWGAVLAGLEPSFMRISVEYRTDILWMTLWLASLAALLAGPLTRRRALVAGLLLGATVSVSMKTSLLAAALGGGAILLAVLPARRGPPPALARWANRIAFLVLGTAIVPGVLAAWFAAHHAWGAMIYGTVTHNIVPGLGRWQGGGSRAILLPLSILVLAWIATRVRGAAPDPATGARRALLFLATFGYLAALAFTWPLITEQDILPAEPIVLLLATGWVLGPGERILGRAFPGYRAAPGWILPAAAGAIMVADLLGGQPVRQDNSAQERAFLGEVLTLTRPGETVFDIKGETVFRRRPFYYDLEAITRYRIHQGLIRDTIPDSLIASRTCVVVEDQRNLPDRARGFMNAHYLPVGRLRVVGRMMPPAEGNPALPRWFDVPFPERFALVSPRGPARGELDGTPYRAPRHLAPGTHTYLPASGEGDVAALWASALERGFSPFTRQ